MAIRVLILTLAFSIGGFAQQAALTPEQESALKQLNELNNKVVALFNSGKIEEALPLSLKCREIAISNNIADDSRVLPAIRNLGEIYFAKGKESEAAKILEEVLLAYEKQQNIEQQNTILRRLSLIYLKKGDYKKSAEFAERLASTLEKAKSTDNEKYIEAISYLANVYVLSRKFDQAEELHKKVILTSIKIFGRDDARVGEGFESYECFIYKKTYLKTGQIKLIYDTDDYKYYEAFSESLEPPKVKSQQSIISAGIVNGKAISLVKPPYPQQAKVIGASGFAIVRVEIDEKGVVTMARMSCGVVEFKKDSEEAAMKSRFTPTILAGKPVKVTGQIVYNFTR